MGFENRQIRQSKFPLACSYSALILHNDEMTLRRKWKQRKRNQRSLTMTGALVFLTRFLL
uniref:Uncharacterized protein n=1 Tax=Ailuropoda melanoleuca TaxID=9646 RepID=A0A7N5KEE3_AILME